MSNFPLIPTTPPRGVVGDRHNSKVVVNYKYRDLFWMKLYVSIKIHGGGLRQMAAIL